jgi:hypothetical protein
MTDGGKPGKPTTGFPPFPLSLEIRKSSGFPHSPSFEGDSSLYKVKLKNLDLNH